MRQAGKLVVILMASQFLLTGSMLAQGGSKLAARQPAQSTLAEQETKREQSHSEGKALDDAVNAWLTQHAIPLKRVTAGGGFDDLLPLKSLLKNVRIVGLGEASHGTREFFQFKHRVLEFLVREMGFNIFAMEANYATCLEINDYVMGGKVDRAAVQRDLFMIWRTEEVLALIEWIRAYNRIVPQGRKVRFYGFDIQDISQAASVVKGYLDRVAPDRVERAEALINKVKEVARSAYADNSDVSSRVTPLLSGWQELLTYFVLNEASFVHRTSQAEYNKALQHLRLLIQYTDDLPSRFSYLKRDRYMADNILYSLSQEGADARMVVWAHNGHVLNRSGESTEGQFASMGHYLHQALGPAYYAFGFAFGQGSFQAFDPSTNRLREYTVGPPPEKSIDWYLARPGIGDYVIDVRLSSQNESVKRWLTTERGMRVAEAAAPANIKELWAEGKQLAPTNLSEQFDGMIFIEHTTAAKPVMVGTSK